MFECALCGSSHPWGIVAEVMESDLPLQLGDIVCKSCSDGLPKNVQYGIHVPRQGFTYRITNP